MYNYLRINGRLRSSGGLFPGETLCLKTKGSPPDPFPKKTNFYLKKILKFDFIAEPLKE